MSTRAVVKVINGRKSIEFYHHFDGYPSGLGMWLLKEMKKIEENDQYGYQHPTMYLSKWVKEFEFEPTLHNHCDIEYYYEFDIAKHTVICKSVNNWERKMEVYETIYMKEYAKNGGKDIRLYEEDVND